MPLLRNVAITSVGAEGNAVARVGDMVIFVPMLIPGDVADIQVRRKRKRYMEGEVVTITRHSPDRISPVCSHFGTCGGCKWQHLPYELQLKWKTRQIFDNFTRIGRIEMDSPPPISGAANHYFYRNKLEFAFSSRRWLTRSEIDSGDDYSGSGALGFHIPGFFDKVLDIKECHLQPEPSNGIRNTLREFAVSEGLDFYDPLKGEGLLRNLTVRTSTTGEVMILMVFGREEPGKIRLVMDFLKESFPGTTSLMYMINLKKNDSISDLEAYLWSGKDHLMEELDGLHFRVGPKSFYQTNPVQAGVLYDVACRFAGLTGKETVYDLYCGTGTISCYAARKAARVIGLEYIGEAVSDARENANINSLENTEFHAGDIRDLLNITFLETHGFPDVIITDPPRAGMHGDVVKAILQASPEVIVYVSCNPATQARDILLLSERYRVDAVQAVDMFPQTHHIENVVRLVLKEGLEGD